ncbi:MAG: ABC transporter ATP-binding protein/permease [Clostridia bacterium]|nr:ABC transporter ATP-binding protein/permease [Clostridia bacterium]
MPGEKARDFKGTILTLFGYLRPYKWQLVVVGLMALFSTLFAIVSPTVLGMATDIVVKGVMGSGVDYHALLMIILVLVGLYLLSWLFGAIQAWIMAIVSQKIIYTLRERMSKKLDRLPLKYFDRVSYGDVQSRMINDIETINQTLTASITQMITAIITLIGILVMMLRISLIMTLAAMVVIPASMLVIKLVVSRSQGHFKNQQKYLGKVNGHVEEMFSGHDIVKAFNREDVSEAVFDEYNDKLYESAWKSQFLSGLMMPLTQVIGNMAYVMVCFLGGYLAINGKVSIGQIQAFIQYVRSFNQPVQQVANIANQLQSTAAAAERVFELLDEEEEEDAYGTDEEPLPITARVAKDMKPLRGDASLWAVALSYMKESVREAVRVDSLKYDFTSDVDGDVAFEHVKFGYVPDEPIIKDFSFAARAGQRVAIVGPTGAGKTTLVKLLMRYYELDGGRILVDGVDIKGMSRHELRSKFGMVLQETWLSSNSIRENIRYGRTDATDEEVEAAARAAHVDHFIKTLPGGYDMEINEEASNISAGQKQLLTIARAILANAPILILDEATSSVDTRTERIIQKAMANLMENRTSFIIAHRLSTIKDADHILVLDHGDIVEQGSHEELLAKGGFYARLYNSQFAN